MWCGVAFARMTIICKTSEWCGSCHLHVLFLDTCGTRCLCVCFYIPDVRYRIRCQIFPPPPSQKTSKCVLDLPGLSWYMQILVESFAAFSNQCLLKRIEYRAVYISKHQGQTELFQKHLSPMSSSQCFLVTAVHFPTKCCAFQHGVHRQALSYVSQEFVRRQTLGPTEFKSAF